MMTAACAMLLTLAPAQAPAQAQAQAQAAPARLPEQVLEAPPIAAPVDRPFAGAITLDVDATDVAHRIFVVRETVPLQDAGPVTLLYPRWEVASHGPSLTVTDLAGLEVSAGGRPLRWRRDPVDPHAFHVVPPPGSRSIELRFEMVAAGDALTPDIVLVPWQRLILYPAGWYARDIAVAPTLRLPDGLRAFTSLAPAADAGGRARFATTSMETLLDAPVLAGRYARPVPIAPRVTLDVVAMRPGDLALPDGRIAELRRLAGQIAHVFGPPPYARYDVLARLSDEGSVGGTEHRASSELVLGSTHWRDWAHELPYRDLPAHEMVHAWNGFYRVPADLWTPTPNVPVGGSLLWVYEGQTEFWGQVLAARAGQFSPAEWRDRVAIEAAAIAARPGRAWRSLSDDVNYPSFMLRQAVPWRDWQRRRDYYGEGVMLWLDVDAELRARSGGARGIDDFAHAFFAGASGDAPARTYDFDALCAALAAVAPGDWAAYLRGWIDAHAELDTTRGLARHGWRLAFTDTPTEAFRQAERDDGVTDLDATVGLSVTAQGAVRRVAWNGPAFRAGLRPGVRIVAVGAAPFTPDALVAAVRASEATPPVVSIDADGAKRVVTLPYRGPLRYPRLEPVPGSADTLTALLTPR